MLFVYVNRVSGESVGVLAEHLLYCNCGLSAFPHHVRLTYDAAMK